MSIILIGYIEHYLLKTLRNKLHFLTGFLRISWLFIFVHTCPRTLYNITWFSTARKPMAIFLTFSQKLLKGINDFNLKFMCLNYSNCTTLRSKVKLLISRYSLVLLGVDFIYRQQQAQQTQLKRTSSHWRPPVVVIARNLAWFALDEEVPSNSFSWGKLPFCFLLYFWLHIFEHLKKGFN